MLRFLLSLWLLVAAPAWAEGPQFVVTDPGMAPCVVSVPLKAWNAYLSPVPFSPTAPGVPIGAISVTMNYTPGVAWTWPCPTTPGQYYVQLRAVDFSDVEGQRGDSIAFVILGSAPPLDVFAVGAKVKTKPPLLNVRATPGITGAYLAAVPAGSTGTLVEGPTLAPGSLGNPTPVPWWRIKYTAGPLGWSLESALGLVP